MYHEAYPRAVVASLVLINDGGTIKLKIEGGPGPGFSRHLFSKSKTEWGDMGDWSGQYEETNHVLPPMVSSIQERSAFEGARHEHRGMFAPPRSNQGAGVDGIVLCMLSIFGLSVRAQRYLPKLAYTTTCNSDE
ncbi:hypothetical protein NEUTE2DRAFT_129690 [Neurospora tetrasperma FGSC 2509]|nr:hypothetical protein NEUTE2DRAFT_129690 [Neurospora tetrasperma FGSC 2509]